MIDFENTLQTELEQLVPSDSRRDWNEIAAASGLKRERALRRVAAAVGTLAAATLLAVATPLGATLGQRLDDFSAWLSGDPGTPASETDQREFEAADARSWLRFPQGTRLRHLVTEKAGDSTVTLFGFRSGASSLCLRLTVTGPTPAAGMDCAPLAELRRAGAPVRVVIIDRPVGKGEKFAWYGIDRLHSAQLQITAGIAADGVQSVIVEDEAGRHEVPASSNSFLYVALEPDVGQRVTRIWARTRQGRVVIPFAQAPFGYLGRPPPAVGPAEPPIEREVTDGRIGWLDRHEQRGESLDVLPADAEAAVFGRGPRTRSKVIFGRVLTPEPDRPLRVVLTLNSARVGGKARGLCQWLVTRRGASGGCTLYPDIFRRSQITTSLSSEGSSSYVTVDGIASDHVARVEALLADGQRADVSLEDNVFAVDLPRARLPARLVAFDRDDRVIDVSDPMHDFGARSGPARGRAKSLLRVGGPQGFTAELFVGPSSDGGECMFLKHFLDEQHTGVMVGCHSQVWSGPAVQLGGQFEPPRLVSGRVHSDVTTVRIRFADGSSTTLTPTRGYVLWAVPEEHRVPDRLPVEASGLRDDGTVVGRQDLGPPRSADHGHR
jgi:hypothetical protein